MLSQILPGFRDFRTPLVVGSLWLALVWLLLGMPVPDKESKTGIFGLINSLGDYLPAAAIAAIISFSAYVVGITFVVDSKTVNWAVKFVNKIKFNFYVRKVDSPEIFIKRLDRQAEHRAIKKMTSSEQMQSLVYRALEHSTESSTGREYIRELSNLVTSLERELPLLGSKLLEKNKELYDVFDRLRSEADFRFGISFPLLSISVERSFHLFSLGKLFSPIMVLILGLIIFAFLFIRGLNKLQESRETVLSMVNIGVISSDAIERRIIMEPKEPKEPKEEK